MGRKRAGPSGIAPVRGIGTPPNSELICSLKKTNSRGHGRLPPFSKIDRHACFIVKDRSCAEKIKA